MGSEGDGKSVGSLMGASPGKAEGSASPPLRPGGNQRGSFARPHEPRQKARCPRSRPSLPRPPRPLPGRGPGSPRNPQGKHRAASHQAGSLPGPPAGLFSGRPHSSQELTATSGIETGHVVKYPATTRYGKAALARLWVTWPPPCSRPCRVPRTRCLLTVGRFLLPAAGRVPGVNDRSPVLLMRKPRKVKSLP